MAASKKSYRTWIYHKTEQPKIIDSENFESYEKEGWKDSPAFFLKPEDFGMDRDDIVGNQSVADSIEGVKESLNGALNLQKMNRHQLEEYAMEHYGIDIDRRKSHNKLLKEVRAMVNGDGK